MAELPARHEAHLVVAAVRVLDHVEKHPPTEAEIAALLQWHEDRARVVAHGLVEFGALSAIKSPFEVRYRLGDHTRLDELAEGEGVDDSISKEMKAFEQRSKADQEEIERMFGTMPSADRGETPPTKDLEDDFGEFARRKPKNPFGDG